MDDNSVSFSPFASARTKFVLMGPPGALGSRVVSSVRSLNNFEHVNIAYADGAGGVSGVPARRIDESMRELRHWFFGRRRSHGFLLEGFPFNTLQALVLDEWLEARDETLTACLWFDLSANDAFSEASQRLVCPSDGSVTYAADESVVTCSLCGTAMTADAERAEREVQAWFQNRATETASLGDYYKSCGQLFRFDANQADFDEVANTVEAISGDR